MRTLTLLLTLFISTHALACPSHLKVSEGDSVPCSGMFFNDSMELSLRKDVRDNELRKKQIELKDLQIEELSNDRDKWAKSAHIQAKARHDQDNDFRNGAIVGVGLTVLSIFAAGQIK